MAMRPVPSITKSASTPTKVARQIFLKGISVMPSQMKVVRANTHLLGERCRVNDGRETAVKKMVG